ncbi:hypothetical protein [Flavivirga aquatica]|uniref:hypothetical protein n=1 Tax=Flavivirga aquatica TaxID=1849968 RepID=UPI0013F4DD69|nr:hypothetical protein [Flavivirga aquatica]
MKTLKITLIAALIFSSLTSCTKQDLNEDEVLTTPEIEESIPYTDGDMEQR